MTDKKKMIDFASHRKIYFGISITFVVISLLATFLGVDLAIEFKGGTIISYSYEGNINVNKAKSDIEEIVNSQINLQQGDTMDGDAKTLTITFSSEQGLTAEKQSALTSKLTETYSDNSMKLLDSNDISPTSGKEFFAKCLFAVAVASLLLILYIAWRFKKISGWSAGVFAIMALIHDVIISYGAFILMGFEINANFMAVILTILGCSINNTIVVYDRIRENTKLMPRVPLSELINVSVNQSFKRSIRTTVASVSSMIIVCIVAYVSNIETIITFAFPMIIGMALGAYSSLCLSPALWLTWQEKYGKKAKKA